MITLSFFSLWHRWCQFLTNFFIPIVNLSRGSALPLCLLDDIFCFNNRSVQTQHPKDRMWLLTLALFFVHWVLVKFLSQISMWMADGCAPRLTHSIVLNGMGTSQHHCLALSCFEQMDHGKKNTIDPGPSLVLLSSAFVLSHLHFHLTSLFLYILDTCFLGVLVWG